MIIWDAHNWQTSSDYPMSQQSKHMSANHLNQMNHRIVIFGEGYCDERGCEAVPS